MEVSGRRCCRWRDYSPRSSAGLGRLAALHLMASWSSGIPALCCACPPRPGSLLPLWQRRRRRRRQRCGHQCRPLPRHKGIAYASACHRYIGGRRGALNGTVRGDSATAFILRQIVRICIDRNRSSAVPLPFRRCPQFMLSGSVSVAVTGKPTRGCRVDRFDRPVLFSMLVTFTVTSCSSELPSVSVTFTVTSYTLFAPESPGDS